MELFPLFLVLETHPPTGLPEHRPTPNSPHRGSARTRESASSSEALSSSFTDWKQEVGEGAAAPVPEPGNCPDTSRALEPWQHPVAQAWHRLSCSPLAQSLPAARKNPDYSLKYWLFLQKPRQGKRPPAHTPSAQTHITCTLRNFILKGAINKGYEQALPSKDDLNLDLQKLQALLFVRFPVI